MTALTRFLRKRREKDYKSGESVSKFYKSVTTTSIVGVFLTCGILVLAFAGVFKLTTFLFGLIATLSIVSIACLLLLPWIKTFERKEFKKTATVFMIFIAVCALLWIISVYLGINLYVKAKNNLSADLSGTLKFIKVTLILSLQLLTSSLVASTIVKFRKSMIFLQIVTYASNLYFDIFVTYFLICFQITSKGLEISEGIKILGNKTILTIFALAVVYMIISSAVMKRIEARRFIQAVDDNYYGDGTRREIAEQNNEPTIEEKLESLKSMFDKGLISQEEYDSKKSEILKDM